MDNRHISTRMQANIQNISNHQPQPEGLVLTHQAFTGKPKPSHGAPGPARRTDDINCCYSIQLIYFFNSDIIEEIKIGLIKHNHANSTNHNAY